MRPFTRTIIELFDGKRRYLIPLYQRQYAWKVTPQLELLWEDIDRAARHLEKAGQLSAPHFMGAIVISQMKTFGKQVQAFEVIDGQQRLTTFQLLLSALRDVAASLSSEYANEVSKYLFNDGVMETSEVERFKLWPSMTDRSSFINIVDPSGELGEVFAIPDDEQGVVRPSVAAYAFFRARIEQHVFVDGAFSAFRMEKLFEALRSGLAVVSIELEGGDDAQTIFETLNSRGVDLTAGDLMRNFIFQRAKGLGQTKGSLNIDKLYQSYWLPLDRWFWREGDTRGRQTRSRLDWLFVDHLAMMRSDLVSADHLFESYRKWILEDEPFDSIEEELKAIQASAAIYRRIAEQSPDDPLGRFGRFAKAFDVSTAMPLVLYLATQAGLPEGIATALTLIESYIVRRDICGLPTANYNRFFVDIIAKLRAAGSEPLAMLHEALSSSQAEVTRWPTDKEWKDSWLGRDQYKASRQPRLRHLFEAIEHVKRANDGEIIAIKSDLTLEHIMPQKWRQNWPVPGFDHLEEGEVDVEHTSREMDRERAINKLGNLTLLTHKLNASISNSAFPSKMPAVRAHAALTLNRELHHYEHWDEESILQRGALLFETARTIWPAPVSPE
ncbi:DUF262 domain-containing protein [Mesorhizobium sp. B4-1-4]|uniref:DUF262 domain-containing protein n=1 Tax=Mesorhizobium sp. B4-1-4 TaxID=2589888 RepID=UPI00112A4BBD|nr:DUF262 domain-containing protein [Mesorhizobium sp. B4-1-4]UCI29447.1 DUF262 domain-containing HNH endonuclease family protein [Mesorhizobium sp. B4-1-4]